MMSNNFFHKFFLVVATCALLGCAAQTERVWQKPNSSQQDFYVDSGQCRAQAYGAPGMPLFQVVMIFESCMAGKGWYTVEVPKK
jgi:hypothetical protein